MLLRLWQSEMSMRRSPRRASSGGARTAVGPKKVSPPASSPETVPEVTVHPSRVAKSRHGNRAQDLGVIEIGSDSDSSTGGSDGAGAGAGVGLGSVRRAYSSVRTREDGPAPGNDGSASASGSDEEDGDDSSDETFVITTTMREEEERIKRDRDGGALAPMKPDIVERPAISEEEKRRLLTNMLEKASAFAAFVNEEVGTPSEAVVVSRDEDDGGGGCDEDSEQASAASPGKKRKRGAAGPASKSRRAANSNARARTEGGSPAPSSKGKSTRKRDAAKHKQPALVTGGKLRDYQLQGVKWLMDLWTNGMSGILADEMGLGKTVQVIAHVAQLLATNIKGPFLIVGPLSTVNNWVREFRRFFPSANVLLYHGSISEREELRRERLFGDGGRAMDDLVMVTSYEIVMNDSAALRRVPEFQCIIVDEGQRLKNMNCRLIRELKELHSAQRIILSGTPLQNNMLELWSLLHFLLPHIFDDADFFQRCFNFDDIGSEGGTSDILAAEMKDQIVSKLHEIIRPFLLRRVKADVDLDIPAKVEVVVWAPLTTVQRKLYTAALEHSLRPTLAKMGWARYGEKPGNRGAELTGSLQNLLMQLRKVCNHPYLFAEPVREEGDEETTEELVEHCGKLKLLDKMLRKLKADGHKVLLFSQMTRLLDILEDYMTLRDYSYRRIDGSTSISERGEAMDAFNDDPSVFCFLLSTRAGGLGINLVAADTVILFDSDWNPHQDSQAQDRCHRIGQKRPVVVYRLVTEHSVETRMLERANAKRKLERLVISGGKFKRRHGDGTSLSINELKELLRDDLDLRKGVQNAIREPELRAILDRPRAMAAGARKLVEAHGTAGELERFVAGEAAGGAGGGGTRALAPKGRGYEFVAHVTGSLLDALTG